MSDDGSTVVEKKGRGRPKSNGTQSVSIQIVYVVYLVSTFMYWLRLILHQEPKGDSKKRGRPPAATKAKESAKSSDDEQAPIAKRGRGRPKGTKKRAAPKARVCLCLNWYKCPVSQGDEVTNLFIFLFRVVLVRGAAVDDRARKRLPRRRMLLTLRRSRTRMRRRKALTSKMSLFVDMQHSHFSVIWLSR